MPVYRKGSAANPSETQWLNPTIATKTAPGAALYKFVAGPRGMIAGLLWEERRPVRHIEVEFPKASGTGLDRHKLSVIARNGCAVIEERPAGFEYGRSSTLKESVLSPAGDPVASPQGATRFAYHCPNDINSLKVFYSGDKEEIGTPVVRAYGDSRWAKPVTLEIEWGFQSEKAGQRWDGWVDAYNGRVGKLEPLEEGCGVVVLGEHHWKDGQSATARRGIKVQLFPAVGPINTRTVVTLWTTGGNVSVAAGDLDRGPILIPGVGIYVAQARCAITARQFQEQVASNRLKTVRHQARQVVEESWATAMKRYHGDRVLPEFPPPPRESAMQIDVPEKQLVAQWRLGDWHLKRWSQKLDEDTYCVSIWPFSLKGSNLKTTALGLESSTIIRALDVMGSSRVARGGLNYWLYYVKSSTPSGMFVDLGNGPLTAPGHTPDQNPTGYDQHHSGGHGRVLEACGLHYRMTGDKAWLERARPILKQACDWTIRQRKVAA